MALFSEKNIVEIHTDTGGDDGESIEDGGYHGQVVPEPLLLLLLSLKGRSIVIKHN